MIDLRQSTASQEIPLGIFVDSTDGNTEEAGLTIANTDIKIWKSGATTLASKNSGGATYISNGIYYCVLDATDTDTIGPMRIFVHVSGALAVKVDCRVLDEAVYDALFGTTALATATNITAGTVTTATNVTTVNGLAANVITATSIANDAIANAKIANNAITASKVAADAVDEIVDGIWDAQESDHLTIGSFGYNQQVAEELIVTNVNATISPRATAATLASVETKVDTVDTVVDAIKAKTDALTFTSAGFVDANIQKINDVTIVGNGSGTPWGPA